MRFWTFSDLHVDILDWRPPPVRKSAAARGGRPRHDAVIIAGDICEGFENGIRWIVEAGLDKKPVIVVRGNHEGYRHDYDATMQAAREAARGHPNIHILQDEELVLEAGGAKGDERVRVLGATLWTDYLLRDVGLNSLSDSDDAVREQAMAKARQWMNDHRCIGYGGGTWQPEHALDEHRRSAGWLGTRLAEPFDGPTVVVTHHAPLVRSVDWAYCRDMAASYASDLDHLVAPPSGPGATVWVHGHIHRARSYMHGSCRVLSNPRGYPHQRTGWSPCFTFEVGAGGTRVARRRHLEAA